MVLVIHCWKINYPKRTNLKQQVFIIINSFWDSGTRNWLCCVALGQNLSLGCCKDVGWGCSHGKAWLGLNGLVSGWLIHTAVGRKPQLLTVGPTHRAARTPSCPAAGFPWDEPCARGWGDLLPEAAYHHIYRRVIKFTTHSREGKWSSTLFFSLIFWREQCQRTSGHILKSLLRLSWGLRILHNTL